MPIVVQLLILQDLPSSVKGPGGPPRKANCLNFPAFFGIRLYFVQNVTQGQIRSCYCPKERRCIEVGGIGSFPLNPTWVWSEKNGTQGKNLSLEKGCKSSVSDFFGNFFWPIPRFGAGVGNEWSWRFEVFLANNEERPLGGSSFFSYKILAGGYYMYIPG